MQGGSDRKDPTGLTHFTIKGSVQTLHTTAPHSQTCVDLETQLCSCRSLGCFSLYRLEQAWKGEGEGEQEGWQREKTTRRERGCQGRVTECEGKGGYGWIQ